MTRVRQGLGHNPATFIDNTQVQEPVDILGGWRSTTFPNMNGEVPRFMCPTAPASARTGPEGIGKFVFNAETGDMGLRNGANRAPALRNRRASIGSTRSGGRAHHPLPRKVAAGPRAKSMDNESLRGNFWDSVLSEIQRQQALTTREPGSLSPMKVNAKRVELGSTEMEECQEERPSCQTPEMLPENKHHEKLDELIAQCANLTCRDGPAQGPDDSNDVTMMPSSPSSSEASVTSRLKNNEFWFQAECDLEGAPGDCDPMSCIDFTCPPGVTTGTQ
ncbi:hypothetical protein BSKO_05197 [Bryopsis sp. KO-2023]|nr:hypothetical protein BSKO_05197 [Bryopsis sp. KO-2023]